MKKAKTKELRNPVEDFMRANYWLTEMPTEFTKESVDKTRVYISTKSKDEEKRTFKKLVDILEDDEEYRELLNKAKDEISSCEKKYRELIKLQDLKDIIFDIYKSI